MSGIEAVPSPSILVRDARPEDMPALQAIYAHHVLNSVGTFEEVPPDLAEMNRRREEIQARGFPYIAAERDGMVKGYAYCNSFRPRSAYRFTVEDSVYVAPDAVGQGFGRAAMREVIRRDPSAFTSRLTLARACNDRGDHTEAIAFASRALEIAKEQNRPEKVAEAQTCIAELRSGR